MKHAVQTRHSVSPVLNALGVQVLPASQKRARVPDDDSTPFGCDYNNVRILSLYLYPDEIKNIEQTVESLLMSDATLKLR